MKIPKTFPDLQALSYAREHARAVGDKNALTHFTRLHDRSSAWGGGYGTNIPLLASVLAVAPPGPVLELGAGNFSTLLLAEMCLATGRQLVTLEAEDTWLRKFKDLPGTKTVSKRNDFVNHEIAPLDVNHANYTMELYHPDNPGDDEGIYEKEKWDEVQAWLKTQPNPLRWAVALVDHAAGPGRTDAIEFLRDRADYIVVHDTNNTFFTGVDDCLSSFKFRHDYVHLCPTTTVVSETLSYPPKVGEFRQWNQKAVLPEDRPTSDRPLEGPGEDE